jgi:hypothetical protein
MSGPSFKKGMGVETMSSIGIRRIDGRIGATDTLVTSGEAGYWDLPGELREIADRPWAVRA